jgi:hypothetical protein
MINRIDYITLLNETPDGLYLIPKNQRTYEVCLYAVRKCGFNLYEVPASHKTYEVCLEAINNTDGVVIGMVPVEHRTYELCLIACGKRGQFLEFVPPEHLDEQMYRAAIESGDMNALYFLPHDVVANLSNDYPDFFT